MVGGRVLTNSYQLIALQQILKGDQQSKERGRGLETGIQINDWSGSEAHLIPANCSLIMQGAANLGC